MNFHDKKQLIDVLGNIVMAEIKEIKKSEVYSTSDELQDEEKLLKWIPPSLLLLLEKIVPNSIKRLAVGHALTAATCNQLH